MSYQETATALHESGNNCCQAVLGACCSHFSLDPGTAYHLGAFFGGGVRKGELCGAVSGALMALGLAYGDENNRQCEKSLEFLDAFEAEFGTLRCEELTGGDVANRKRVCPGFINWCAQYLEDEFGGK
jgi:C_GCAxxG_C_C family probable redox protein